MSQKPEAPTLSLLPMGNCAQAGSRCGCHVSLQAEWTQWDILSTWLAPQGLGLPGTGVSRITGPGQPGDGAAEREAPETSWSLCSLHRANRAAGHFLPVPEPQSPGETPQSKREMGLLDSQPALPSVAESAGSGAGAWSDSHVPALTGAGTTNSAHPPSSGLCLTKGETEAQKAMGPPREAGPLTLGPGKVVGSHSACSLPRPGSVLEPRSPPHSLPPMPARLVPSRPGPLQTLKHPRGAAALCTEVRHRSRGLLRLGLLSDPSAPSPWRSVTPGPT